MNWHWLWEIEWLCGNTIHHEMGLRNPLNHGVGCRTAVSWMMKLLVHWDEQKQDTVKARGRGGSDLYISHSARTQILLPTWLPEYWSLMKSDGRARLSLVHESFSFVCGQKANMGICPSAHLRVALEERSSRSVFPVDTVWGYLRLTCAYRMRGGLGLECNHSRAR